MQRCWRPPYFATSDAALAARPMPAQQQTDAVATCRSTPGMIRRRRTLPSASGGGHFGRMSAPAAVWGTLPHPDP
jgi:hypothetical protein